jgi:AmmeMemoRadiSam system protein B
LAIRRPAVAGAFFDANPSSLRKQITDSFNHRLGPGRLPGDNIESGIQAIVAPHAGYVYSGPSAAHAYLKLAEQEKPDTVIVIGPNHTGWGKHISIMGDGQWETPLGNVDLDTEIAQKIVQNSKFTEFDDKAFIREHSVEVQVPFLQFIYPDFTLVPICMGYQDLETSKDLGKAIHEAVEGRNAMIVASSDLNHMESKSVSNRKDRFVLDAIDAMDEVKLQESVRREKISTCGYGPVSATLVASKLGGAKSSEILSYYTSGDIIGDDRQVVGYASAIISRDEK